MPSLRGRSGSGIKLCLVDYIILLLSSTATFIPGDQQRMESESDR